MPELDFTGTELDAAFIKNVPEGRTKMKVLIVVDMQNDFIDGSLGTKEAVGIVDRVAEVIGFV